MIQSKKKKHLHQKMKIIKKKQIKIKKKRENQLVGKKMILLDIWNSILLYVVKNMNFYLSNIYKYIFSSSLINLVNNN